MRILCTKKKDDTPAKGTTTLLPRHQNCIRNGRLGHTWTTPHNAKRKQVPANSMLPFDKIPYPEAIAMPNASANTIARAMVDHIICRHGTPRFVLTDNGTSFISALYESICEFLKIRHVTTTFYHPAANGKLERSRQTLAAVISHFT